MPSSHNDPYGLDLINWNVDSSVTPPVMVRGMMIKSGASWEFWDGSMTATTAPLSADSSRVSVVQGDAAFLRVSSIGGSFTSAPLSADSSSVSAKQGDASFLRTSSILYDDGTVTKFLGRISALGVTLATSQSLSARALEGTAYIGSVSANQAGTWAISATNKEGTSYIGSVSANQAGTWALSATMKEGTAFIGQVSALATLKDNATITNYIGRVSAIQENAGNLRVSSNIYGNTVGELTTFRSLSLSASQAVKAAAGAVYGYYLYNTTTVPQYVKLTNTSGAINVGTDTPIVTFMVPISGAANVSFPMGIKGFTAGIGIHASSAIADNATTPAAASAVGGNIFYI
jgi:hypothetical protein